MKTDLIRNYKLINQTCSTCSKVTVDFFSFDVKDQIGSILKNNLRELKNFTKNRKKLINDKCILAPYDGEVYQNFIKENLHSHMITLSLSLNSDGASETSKNLAMWPVIGTVLELGEKKGKFQ